MCKIGKKVVIVGFLSVTPDYVTINQNLSPIPQIYIPDTTILTKKEFLGYFTVSQKNLHSRLCAKLVQE